MSPYPPSGRAAAMDAASRRRWESGRRIETRSFTAASNVRPSGAFRTSVQVPPTSSSGPCTSFTALTPTSHWGRSSASHTNGHTTSGGASTWWLLRTVASLCSSSLELVQCLKCHAETENGVTTPFLLPLRGGRGPLQRCATQPRMSDLQRAPAFRRARARRPRRRDHPGCRAGHGHALPALPGQGRPRRRRPRGRLRRVPRPGRRRARGGGRVDGGRELRLRGAGRARGEPRAGPSGREPPTRATEGGDAAAPRAQAERARGPRRLRRRRSRRRAPGRGGSDRALAGAPGPQQVPARRPGGTAS